MTRLRCAILDDYLNVALSVADWSKVQDRVDVTVFNQPFTTAEAAAHALKDFEIICAMRERTPFPRTMFAALPNLKLMITSGCATPRSTWRPPGTTAWCCAGPNGAATPPRP